MHIVVPPGGAFRDPRKIELGATLLMIGRSEHCDVRLDVPGVDQEHAKISEVALIAVGQDCAVGDVPLEPGHRRLVMPGDEVQIGSVVLVLEGDDPSILPPPPSGDGPVSLSTRAPRVRVVEGANFGDELVLREEERLYVLGRSPQCDLVLEDREVSREHVKLVRRGFKVFIQDQTSTRGSWLGRAAVYSESTVEWARPRMLRVGQSVLALELPEDARRAAPVAPPNVGMTLPVREPPRAAAAVLAEPAPVAASAPPPPHLPTPRSTPAPPTPRAIAPSVPAEGRDARTTRRAWKRGGPTVGKATGVLLLLGAALAIVAAIYGVFTWLE